MGTIQLSAHDPRTLANRSKVQAPLAGLLVLVTRPAEQAVELSRPLRRYGAEVVEVPMIRIGPPSDPEPARRAVSVIDNYDYLVFTSVNGVAAFQDLAAETDVDLTRPGPLVFAVGPATSAAARRIGMLCQSLSEEFASEGLARALEAHPMTGRKVLMPRSEVGRESLPAALRRRGAEVDDVAVYLTTAEPGAARRLVKVLDSLDVVTFASGSSVAGFVAAVPAGWRRPSELLIAAIGPATARAARMAGLAPDVVAAEQTAAGLADAIADYFLAK